MYGFLRAISFIFCIAFDCLLIYAITTIDFDAAISWKLSGCLEKCCSMDRQNQVNYAGGAIDVNGDIYALPVHDDSILKISFNEHNVNIPQDVYNVFFRDYY